MRRRKLSKKLIFLTPWNAHIRFLRLIYILLKVELSFFCNMDHSFSPYAKLSEICQPWYVHTYMFASGGKRCQFFGKCCVRTKWMTPQEHSPNVNFGPWLNHFRTKWYLSFVSQWHLICSPVFFYCLKGITAAGRIPFWQNSLYLILAEYLK